MPKSISSLLLVVCLCVPASAVTFTDTTIATGISGGTGLAIAPDGRVFVIQQTGQVRIIENGIMIGAPALNIGSFDSALTSSGERGLIGIALDPNFASYVYLHYNREYPGGLYGNRIARFTLTGNTLDPNSMQVLLDNETSGNGGHVGGGMVMGSDGKLYAAIGDRNTPASAQDQNNTWGSILRLNPDGTFAGGNVVPNDNPFCTDQAQLGCTIYAQGLRNPFGLAVQPGTGRIFINDAGEQLVEEINQLAAGANYGWPGCEGACAPPDNTKTDSVYSYSSASGNAGGNCAITGGAFYNPASSSLPGSFYGDYLYLDWCSGRLTALDFAGSPTTTQLYQFSAQSAIALAVDAVGGIYYLDRRDNRVGYLFNAEVPEPATWLTVALGALAAARRRRVSTR